MKKIAICEDHKLVVDGLQSLLSKTDNYSFIGHAGNEAELQILLHTKIPDILILDLNLKDENGLEILQRIRTNNQMRFKILIVTMSDDESIIQKARQLKASGYLLKEYSHEDLMCALEAIETTSDFYLPESLRSRSLLYEKMRDEFVDKMRLTTRELEIIRFVVNGKTNNEISEKLILSTHTIRTHRKNIMKKLNLSNAADLVRFAYENHIV